MQAWYGRLNLRPETRPAVSGSDMEFMLLDAHVQDGAPPLLECAAPAEQFTKAAYEAAMDAHDPERRCTVLLWGVTEAGVSVHAEILGWCPWLRVQVPDSWSDTDSSALRAKFSALGIDGVAMGITKERLKQLCGWEPDPSDPAHTRRLCYLKLSFASLAECRRAERALNDAKISPPTTYAAWRCVDTLQTPRTRFLNDCGLVPSGWVRIVQPQVRSPAAGAASHCQIEVIGRIVNVGVIERDAVAPLVVASFDCEMFSHDGTFPTVGKGDLTYCVCTSFWVYGSNIATQIKRVAIFVGSVAPPEAYAGPDILVHCVPTAADLLPAWRDLIVHADPDIVTAWNCKGFDFPFMAMEHAQHRLPALERSTEGVHAALVRRAHEILGDSALPFETAGDFMGKLRHGVAKGAVRADALRKAIESIRKTCGGSALRSILSSASNALSASARSGFGSLEGTAREACKDESDDEEDDAGACFINSAAAAATSAPEWLQDTLKASPLLEATAARARNILAATMTGAMAADSLRDVLAKLVAVGKEEELWSWARTYLGEGILRLLQSPQSYHGATDMGMMLSRLALDTCVLQERQMTTAAKGDNVFFSIPMKGRCVVDLMQIVKDDKKPDDNSIKFAAKKWIGGGEKTEKIELAVTEIFRLYKQSCQGDTYAAWPVVDYCARDCDIPLLLMDKLQYVPTWVEQSRVCYTPLDNVCNNGQQIKVFNLIARFVQGEFAINPPDSGWPAEDDEEDLGVGIMDEVAVLKKKPSDYVGATVIPPVAGFYADPISTLDFASLYPSIIISFNLCFSTLFRGPLSTLQELAAKHAITYDVHTIQHNLPDGSGGYKEEPRQYAFVTHVPSLLSRLLQRLLTTRKAVKKMLAGATDPFLKAVLKGRELGLKMCANSAYGFTGVSASRGMLPCKPVAAVTTLKGRAMIEATKLHVEKTFPPAKVVYGDTDSVMIWWGPDVNLQRAFVLGETAADQVTLLLQTGGLEGVGGAGALSAARTPSVGAGNGTPTGGSGTPTGHSKRVSPERDLDAAAAIVKLEHEKEYMPYLLFKKKNYAGIKHTPKGTAEDGSILFAEEVDIKGIDAVRRDRSFLLRTLSMDVLNALLKLRSVEGALDTLRVRLDDIVEGRVPMDSFVLSKQIKSHYGTDSIVHAAAWRRMRDRGDEGLPPIGARMPFLITATSNTADKLFQRSEHPAYVARAHKKLDLIYYVTSLKNPMTKLLQFTAPEDVKRIFDGALQRAHIKNLGIGSLRHLTEALTGDEDDAFASSFSNGGTHKLARAREPEREKAAAKPKAKRARKDTTDAPKLGFFSLEDMFKK
jgi:DNA polymerase elongation subunit (family B)